jgi:hypothetical protein
MLILACAWCVVQDFLLKYLGATAAVVLIIGPFFGNHLRPVDNVLGRAHMLSTMRYHTSVVIYLFAALGTLGSSSRKLMRLSAYADRISDMQSTVKGLASSVGSKLLCLVICWRVFGTGRPLQLIARLQGKTLLC